MSWTMMSGYDGMLGTRRLIEEFDTKPSFSFAFF